MRTYDRPEEDLAVADEDDDASADEVTPADDEDADMLVDEVGGGGTKVSLTAT
jgi:hypothetical protein